MELSINKIVNIKSRFEDPNSLWMRICIFLIEGRVIRKRQCKNALPCKRLQGYEALRNDGIKAEIKALSPS